MAFTEKRVPNTPGDRVGHLAMFAICRLVSRLSNGRLDANYYYGLGEIMTVIRQKLEALGAASDLIRQTATDMVKAAMSKRRVPLGRPFVPLLGDILEKGAFKQPILRLAEDAQAELPAPESALINGIHVMGQYRRVVSKHPWSKVSAPLLFGALYRPLRTQPLVADNIAINAFAGAIRVFTTLLTGYTGDLPKGIESMPIIPGDLEPFGPRPYNDAARLRFDELIEGMGWKTDEERHSYLDPSYLDSPPPPAPDGLLHTERQVYPAFHAGGLALYVARHILPGVIRTASSFIPEERYPSYMGRY